MTLANSYWEYTREAYARPRTISFGFLRHFVGIFAVAFSAASWLAVLHFGIHAL